MAKVLRSLKEKGKSWHVEGLLGLYSILFYFFSLHCDVLMNETGIFSVPLTLTMLLRRENLLRLCQRRQKLIILRVS